MDKKDHFIPNKVVIDPIYRIRSISVPMVLQIGLIKFYEYIRLMK